jgi:Xaa-Pro aminopeptidase
VTAIGKDDHARRRQRLLDELGDGLLILPTAPHPLRNGDVHYEFRPGSDFSYLTGFPEPGAVLVAWREVLRGRRGHRAVLFVLPRDREREIWDGRRHGVHGAVAKFGADRAFPIAELWKRLPELLQGQRRVFHALGRDRAFDERLLEVLRARAFEQRRSNPPAHPGIEDPSPAIAALRAVKEPGEIAILERSAAITAAGHVAAMRSARPGVGEFAVQAELEAEFRRHGSPRNGYSSIVASGANACVLHYTQNDRTLRRGELLLVDAGAELEGYTTDVTRTFPVSGAFTPAQRAVYAIVLAAQKAGIRAVRPGARWDAPHRACVRRLTRGLVELGVLRGAVPKLVDKLKYRPWYMHGTSHWLGMDVHDAGAYQRDEAPVRLRTGMVLTVEPGLYFAPRDASVPKELRGIGVRIEDDVLVTRSGSRVLTAAVPKEIADVEACVRGSSRPVKLESEDA